MTMALVIIIAKQATSAMRNTQLTLLLINGIL